MANFDSKMKILYTSILGVLFLLEKVSASRKPESNGTHLICDGKEYDSEGLEIKNMQCCGTILFDKNNKICYMEFDGEAAEIKFSLMDAKSRQSAICLKQVYDTQTQVCCSNEVLTKDTHLLYDQFPRCCGSTQYDVEKHVCCHSTGTLLKISERDPADVYVRTECCDGQLFTNHSQQACCNDKLLDRPSTGRSFCCGSNLLTEETQKLCCNGVVYDRAQYSGKECCTNFSRQKTDDDSPEDPMYDVASQTCCMGYVYEIGKVTACSKLKNMDDFEK